jgi:hypothetical protein
MTEPRIPSFSLPFTSSWILRPGVRLKTGFCIFGFVSPLHHHLWMYAHKTMQSKLPSV